MTKLRDLDHKRLLAYLLIFDAAVIIFTLISADDPKIYYGEFQLVTFISFIKLLAISRVNWNIFKSKGGTVRGINFNNDYALWLIISAGFLFLALDDLFLIHEGTDKLIHFILGMKETGLTDRIDDLIVVVYGVLGLLILYSYRHEIYRYRRSLSYIVFGFGFLFIRIVIDIITNRNDIIPLIISDENVETYLNNFLAITEGATKLLAQSFFLAGFYYCLRKTEQE